MLFKRPKNITVGHVDKDIILGIGDVKFTLKLIPKGCITIDLSQEPDDVSYGCHKRVEKDVMIDDFYLSETVVTQSLWRAVFQKDEPEHHMWTRKRWNGDDYPAYDITWEEITWFIHNISNIFCVKFRLPSKFEWRYAAIGGSQNLENESLNCIDDFAWHKDNSGMILQHVAQKRANGYGLYDMCGNVYEMCNNRLRTCFSVSILRDQTLSFKDARWACGGACLSEAEMCHAESCIRVDTHSKGAIGFRLALDKRSVNHQRF